MASGLHPRCTCSTTRRWPTPPAHPPLGSRVSPLSHRPRARSPEQCCTAGQFCTVVPITLPTRIACLPSRSLESIRTRTSVFPALCGYESCPASPSPSVPCLKTVAPATRAMRQMQRHNIVNCSTAAADCAGEKRKKREREKKKKKSTLFDAEREHSSPSACPAAPAAGWPCMPICQLPAWAVLAGRSPSKQICIILQSTAKVQGATDNPHLAQRQPGRVELVRASSPCLTPTDVLYTTECTTVR